jgi:hypothetical protein
MVMGVFYSIYTYNIDGKGTTKERTQKGEEDTLANFAKRGGRFG